MHKCNRCCRYTAHAIIFICKTREKNENCVFMNAIIAILNQRKLQSCVTCFDRNGDLIRRYMHHIDNNCLKILVFFMYVHDVFISNEF